MTILRSDLTAPTDVPAVRRDAYYWRLIGTGLSFFAFGLGAVVVGAILLPIVRLAPASRSVKRSRARAVMQASLRMYIAGMARARLMTYEFRGVDRLVRPGQLIVANHPSLLDVVFLLAFTRGVGCVVKEGLWRNPLTRGAVTLAEFITNDPTPAMIEAAAAALKAGEHLIMFPEGTRTLPGASPTFHRGAANVALRAAQVVTPVYIRVEPTTLTKAEPWHRIPFRRPHFSLVVGEDFDLSPYRRHTLPIASRRLNDDLEAHFKEQLRSASLGK